MDASWTFSHALLVHLRDIDGLGHVNNAVYLTWLETARNRWVFEATGKRQLADFDFILAQTSINYRAAAGLHEEIEVRLRPLRAGNSSWELEYEVRRGSDGKLLADARSVQVSYDYAAAKPMPIPAEFRGLLERELARLAGAR